MNSVRALKLNGIAVPLLSSVELRQRYTKLRARDRERTASGKSYQRIGWGGAIKLATTISGAGPVPFGLTEEAIDYNGQITLSCIKARGIVSNSPNIVLPSARRSDVGSTPYGCAFVRGLWVPVNINMNVDTAELSPLPNADQYEAFYFPEIIVHADPPEEDKPQRGPTFSWTLEAEEV